MAVASGAPVPVAKLAAQTGVAPVRHVPFRGAEVRTALASSLSARRAATRRRCEAGRGSPGAVSLPATRGSGALAAAGAAQTMITRQASSMVRVPHRMGGIAAARGRGMVLSIMFLSPQPRSASVVKRSLSMAARKNGRHGAACCVLLPAPQGVPTSRRHCSHHRYSQGFLRRADIPFSS